MLAESLLRKDMHERHTIELEYGRQLNRLDSHKSLGKLQLKYANSLANADSWQDFLSAERDMLNSRLQLVNNLMSNSAPVEAAPSLPPPQPIEQRRQESRQQSEVLQPVTQSVQPPVQQVQIAQTPPVEPTKAGKMLVKRGDVVSGWKSRWFSLKEGILYCYDTPTTGENPGRPRDVINLTSAKVYSLHESYFHRPHCFQIILLEPGRIVFNLVAENARERDSWIAALRPECCSSCDASPNEFKTIRGLDVKILEAKGISLQSNNT
jgi:hypothetical protein